jgi:hypothetical protein
MMPERVVHPAAADAAKQPPNLSSSSFLGDLTRQKNPPHKSTIKGV